MSKREVIEKSFMELVGEMPYTKISVTDICERAGVSRKMFYTEFENKEDVVRALFERHAVRPSKTLNKMLSLSDLYSMEELVMAKFYEGIYEQREYYINLIGPIFGKDDVFIRVATNTLLDFNEQLLPQLGNIGNGWQAEYTCYFFASSQSMYLQKWIRDKMPVSPHELASHYLSMTSAFWRGLTEK